NDGTGSAIVTDHNPSGNNGVLTNMDASSDWIRPGAPLQYDSSIGVTLTVTDSNGNTDTCVTNVTIEEDQLPVLADYNIEVTDLSACCMRNSWGEWQFFEVTEAFILDRIEAPAYVNGAVDMTAYIWDGEPYIPGSSVLHTLNLGEFDGTAPGAKIDFSAEAVLLDPGFYAFELVVPCCAGPDMTWLADAVAAGDPGSSYSVNGLTFLMEVFGSTCTPDITVNADQGTCNTDVNYITPFGVDNCNTPSEAVLMSGFESGETFDVGTYTVEYQIQDRGYNSVNCSFDITVEDNELPIAQCYDVVVPVDAPTSISVSSVKNTTSDNCGIQSEVLSNTTFDCSDIGKTPVNLTNGTFTGGVADVVSVTGYAGALNYSTGPGLGSTCSEAWFPRGTLCDGPGFLDDPDYSYKDDHNSGATWTNGTPGTSYGSIVIDIGSQEVISDVSVFQMNFSDGKTTEIEGWYHPNALGTPPADDDPGWVQLFPYTSVGPGTIINPTVISDPLKVSFTAVPAQYVKFHAINDGSLGNSDYIEIRSIKLFGPENSTILTVTDDSGNKGHCASVVTVQNSLTFTASEVSPEVCGQSNGVATVVPAASSYMWSNGETTQTISGLSAGTYTVVTDNNGCLSTSSVTVNAVGGPTCAIASTDNACGLANGDAIVVASGGSGGYS
ncbi:MAG: HYR domain-containing protein, partial [Bacteroidia bacterium]|nr:HYR domain-containing protein [Bacteroidia bacterium]